MKCSPSEGVRKRLTANKKEGVSGTSQFRKKMEMLLEGYNSTVDEDLQSMSHQPANDQSIPLMIFNHTGC